MSMIEFSIPGFRENKKWRFLTVKGALAAIALYEQIGPGTHRLSHHLPLR